MKKFINEEKGDILILFALMFTVLAGFISLAYDFGAMYYERSKMMETAQIMRDTRFTEDADVSIMIHNSDTPAQAFTDNFAKYAALNGFQGTLEVTYYEAPKTDGKERVHSISFTLTKEYVPQGLMKLVNSNPIPIKVKIDGVGSLKSSGGGIWYPSVIDNGTYTVVIP